MHMPHDATPYSGNYICVTCAACVALAAFVLLVSAQPSNATDGSVRVVSLRSTQQCH